MAGDTVAIMDNTTPNTTAAQHERTKPKTRVPKISRFRDVAKRLDLQTTIHVQRIVADRSEENSVATSLDGQLHRRSLFGWERLGRPCAHSWTSGARPRRTGKQLGRDSVRRPSTGRTRLSRAGGRRMGRDGSTDWGRTFLWGGEGRWVRVCTVLQHAQAVLPVLARVEVVVLIVSRDLSLVQAAHLQSVHLPVPLQTARTDSTNKRPGPFLCFFY